MPFMGDRALVLVRVLRDKEPSDVGRLFKGGILRSFGWSFARYWWVRQFDTSVFSAVVAFGV